MPIIYDGFLQDRIAEYIAGAAADYGHALEMSSLPPSWTKWSEENLFDYLSHTEDCMGGLYTRWTKRYCIVRRDQNGEPLFLFLKTAQEKAAVIRDFPDLIISDSPFKTVIS